MEGLHLSSLEAPNIVVSEHKTGKSQNLMKGRVLGIGNSESKQDSKG